MLDNAVRAEKNCWEEEVMRTIILLLAAARCAGAELIEIEYLSAADNTMQKAFFFDPKPEKAVPLIVALHTWSSSYKQRHYGEIEKWCLEKGWAFIYPDFRGPARRPEATGSELVVKDIVSAVDYAKKTTRVDEKAVFLLGVSGGGYHSLMMAGKHPELWAGVSAWASISDLKAWHDECVKGGMKYSNDVVKSCGGRPGASAAVDAEYRKRSPVTYLAKAKGKVPLHIATGMTDGHNGSVPISHSLHAFNEVADEKDRIPAETIARLTAKPEVPGDLINAEGHESYGQKHPLFERSSASATVTIFKGGHEIVQPAAIAWIEELYSERLEIEKLAQGAIQGSVEKVAGVWRLPGGSELLMKLKDDGTFQMTAQDGELQGGLFEVEGSAISLRYPGRTLLFSLTRLNEQELWLKRSDRPDAIKHERATEQDWAKTLKGIKAE